MSGSKVIDLTLDFEEHAVSWPGDAGYTREWVSRIDEGASNNLSHLTMSLHTLTHVDAPLHFVRGGKAIDQLPVDLFVGDCLVLEISTGDHIRREDLLDRVPAGTRRLLLKTTNSRHIRASGFKEDFVALLPGAAALLVEVGVELVGLDYLSIGPYGPLGTDVHREFLGAGDRAALEGIDLGAVEPGHYHLICPPLRLKGAEASPVRAILYGPG